MGFSIKFHSYTILFSHEILIMLDSGLTAEHTIGATMDSNKITPFFSSISIFSNCEAFSKDILALSSITIKSLQLKFLTLSF